MSDALFPDNIVLLPYEEHISASSLTLPALTIHSLGYPFGLILFGFQGAD
jgi:hypothetical protein